MIYITSKGEEVRIESLNDFHLLGAAKKADEIVNFFTGFSNSGNVAPEFRHEEWGYVDRYLKMIHLNLWAEVEKRDLQNPIKTHFLKTFHHLGDGDKQALWNFMKTNFKPKE